MIARYKTILLLDITHFSRTHSTFSVWTRMLYPKVDTQYTQRSKISWLALRPVTWHTSVYFVSEVRSFSCPFYCRLLSLLWSFTSQFIMPVVMYYNGFSSHSYSFYAKFMSSRELSSSPGGRKKIKHEKNGLDPNVKLQSRTLADGATYGSLVYAVCASSMLFCPFRAL